MPSCKNLFPTAFIYPSTLKKCVTYCPYNNEEKKYVDETTDPDNPTCVEKCPSGYYIDSLTTDKFRTCVKSCRNLNPIAYIYPDPDNDNKLTCVRACPSDKTNYVVD